MRIYISGKVTGSDDYWRRFADAESRLRNEGADVVNPAREVYDAGFAMYPYEQIMEYCFSLMDDCEVIYMLNGWQDSPGAKRELERANAAGMRIIYEEE